MSASDNLSNEVLGPLVIEFALNFVREGATPTQPGFNAVASRLSNSSDMLLPGHLQRAFGPTVSPQWCRVGRAE